MPNAAIAAGVMHAYEVRPRKDKRGVDLISDALPFGGLWYTKVSDAVDYAKFYSRSHDAVIRVYDDAGNVIETHEHAASSGSGELAVTSIASSNLSSVSLLTGTIPKPQRTIRSCVSRTTERGTCFIAGRTTTSAGCCIWRSRLSTFRCAGNPRQPKSGAPTKPDNTQTGQIEIR